MKDRRFEIAFNRWNDTVSESISTDHRIEVNKIVAKALAGKSILAIGPRGVGKSSILNDIFSILKSTGRKVFRVDLDDPASFGISKDHIIELIEKIGFFENTGNRYLVVDEARRLGEFEELCNILIKSGIIIIASASASVDFAESFPEYLEKIKVYLPSFPEYIKKITDKTVDISESRDYFEGYIRSNLNNDKQNRRYRSLYSINRTISDIVFFNEVREFKILNDISVYLAASPAKEISANSLKRFFNCSIDMMRAFLSHVEESGLVSLVRRFEDRKRPAQASRICMPHDIALSLELGAPEDAHDLAMVAVFRELKKICKSVYTVKTKSLIGFCSQEGENTAGPVPNFSIYVSYPYEFEKISSEVRLAASRLGSGIITVLSSDSEPYDDFINGCTLRVRPIWLWALMPMAEAAPTDMTVDIYKKQASDKKKPEGSISPSSSGSMPSHLL